MVTYSGPVIDTHHHIWLRKDVSWLKDPPSRRAIGDFFGLRRDVPIQEWMHDVAPQGIVKSVHVTANWGPGHVGSRGLLITMDFHMGSCAKQT